MIILYYSLVVYVCFCYVRFSSILASTLRGSRPGVQSASLIMTSLMTS